MTTVFLPGHLEVEIAVASERKGSSLAMLLGNTNEFNSVISMLASAFPSIQIGGTFMISKSGKQSRGMCKD